MAHYRTMFDAREHIGAWDLGGKDRTVEIEAVVAGSIGRGKDKAKKPIITIKTGKGVSRTMACNITNARTLATLYGSETKTWIGKRITLYPTTATFGSEIHEAIRIRPMAPGDKTAMSEFAEVSAEEREAHLAKLDRAAGRVDGELSEEEERRMDGANRGA